MVRVLIWFVDHTCFLLPSCKTLVRATADCLFEYVVLSLADLADCGGEVLSR